MLSGWAAHYMYNSALNRAINDNSLEEVKKAVQQGADVYNTWDSYAPLIASIMKRHREIAKYLLDNGVDPNKPQLTYKNKFVVPLMVAIEEYDLKTMDLLIKAGANPNWGDGVLLNSAIKENSVQLVARLLEAGADPNPNNKEIPLIVAIKYYNSNLEIIDLLLKKNAHVYAQSGSPEPLNVAISMNNPEVVAKLLDAGANPNDRSLIPLSQALKIGNLEIINLLLKARANPDKGADNEDTPLNYAIIKNSVQLVASLLEGGADLNLFASGSFTPRKFPLLEAYKGGNLEIINLLFARGVDVNAESSFIHYDEGLSSTTPLIHAITSDNEKMVEYLLHRGADPNKKTTSGATPLMTAILYGDDKTVELLLRKGANPNASDLPVLEAIRKGKIGKVCLLLEFGADIRATNDNVSVLEAYHHQCEHKNGRDFKLEALLMKNINLDPALRATKESTPVIDNQHKQSAPSVTSSFCSFPVAKESQAQPMELEPSESKRLTG